MSSSLSTVEAKLETESRAFQDLQKELEKVITSRQRLDAQQQENELVKKEFELLDGDANIYKLIGPVLIKQDKTEADTNVKNRLGLIKSEIERVENQLKDLTEKSEKKKSEIAQLQAQFQQLASAKQ